MAKRKAPAKKPLHKRIKKHHIGIGLVAGVLVWASAAVFSVRPVKVLACNSGGITVTSPAANSSVSGQVDLVAATATSFTGNLVFYLNGAVLGQANSSNNNTKWSLSWNSVSVPNGTYQLMVSDTSGTYCSSPVPFNVLNGSSAGQTLSINLQPGSWNGDTNINVPFSARAIVTSSSSGGGTDVSGATQFTWTTSLGVITGTGPNSMYYSGPNAGTGTVTVTAVYDGMKATASAPIKVTSVSGGGTSGPDSGSSSGGSGTSNPTSPTPSATVSSSTSGETEAETPHPVSQPLDPVVAQCLINSVGQARYQELISGQAEPTQEERLKGAACFKPIHVIPARLAPVDPGKVAALPQSVPGLKVAAAKTEDVTSNGKVNQKLSLSGHGVPGTTVFIYVFSEPLVLQTTVDSQGNWSYQLDNPLKPGHHQVYAVMQQSDGQFTRSLPLPITIAQAESTNSNPQGNSLQVQQDRAVEYSGYLLGAILIVIVGLRALFVMRRRMGTAARAA